jgi:hypothetical protein
MRQRGSVATPTHLSRSELPVTQSARGLLTVIVLCAACMAGKDQYGVVDAHLRRSVPLRMTATDAARTLDSLGIEHSPFEAGSGRMVALVRSTKKDWLIQEDARFELVFDSGRKLTRITGRRVYTGP